MSTHKKRKTCPCARTRNKKNDAKDTSILIKRVENFQNWNGIK